MEIWVKLSPGELIDRITILEIKAARIGPRPLEHVQRELDGHRQAYAAACPDALSMELAPLVERLRSTNRALWNVEDELRHCEAASDFGARFVQLARSVYLYNDERARIKRAISELLGSSLLDEKIFTPASEQGACASNP